MHKRSAAVRDGIIAAAGSLLAMAAAFALYFLIFMLFESFLNRDSSYSWVPLLRAGYGVLWIVTCLILYRTKIPEQLKACVLAGSLTAFMSAFGVLLYEHPVITCLILLFAAAAAVFLLRITNRKWYHFLAVGMSLLAALFYLLP